MEEDGRGWKRYRSLEPLEATNELCSLRPQAMLAQYQEVLRRSEA